ncbi:GNAT family N-acetyltransferase [Pseudonocardia spinosispora]|uniref:GNAT family N-acetyltransferase n=1 Tax=Pseudonocardia spinosispora TaxID=103441 RepID=UPI0003FFF69D|nr:GNAT family N-acetyltransferase [Pseudonocardia spinosispora]
MDVEVQLRDLTDSGDLAELVSLFRLVWGTTETAVPLEVLRALSDTGGMVLGAFAGTRLVGGAVGFRAVDDPVHLHSHVVGVHPDWRRRGIGIAVKHHQRTWCLDRGISYLSWTFDPLLRRNALLNISRLGAVGVAYLVDHYGPLDDVYNAGVPTDRVWVRWDLSGGRLPASSSIRSVTVLDSDQHGRPCRSERATVGPVRLRLPEIVAAEHTLTWRGALRSVMAPRLNTGYRWTGMSDDGWCVLEPPSTMRTSEAR